MDIERQMLEDPLLSDAFKAWVRAMLEGRQAARSAGADRRFHLEAARYWLKRARESTVEHDARAALRRLDALALVLEDMARDEC